MVEKTIFIVKPIYVQADPPTRKKKKKAATKKQIYSEKMKPPNYSQNEAPSKNSGTIKLKKKFKAHNRSIDDATVNSRDKR